MSDDPADAADETPDAEEGPDVEESPDVDEADAPTEADDEPAPAATTDAPATGDTGPDEDLQPVAIEDKLFLDTFHADDESHIGIRDRQVCVDCENKECTTFCPADVYTWDDDEEKIVIGYENCIECTAARYACPYDNIDWVYPQGGKGIQYQYG